MNIGVNALRLTFENIIEYKELKNITLTQPPQQRFSVFFFHTAHVVIWTSRIPLMAKMELLKIPIHI